MRRFRFLLLCFILLPLRVTLAQPPGASLPPPWSAGLFAVTDSQPYRGADGQARVLPFLSYRSRQVEWYGPFFRYRPFPQDPLGFRLRAQLDFGAYDESDAPILEGLGNRRDTLLLGAGVEKTLFPGWSAQLSVDRDVLGRHEGTEAVLGLTRRFGSPFAPFMASVSTGLRFQDRKWTADRVGVPADRAREDRPAYAPGESIHPYISSMVLYRIRENWQASVGLRYEWLDDSWRDSPLVSDRGRLSSMWTLSYSF